MKKYLVVICCILLQIVVFSGCTSTEIIPHKVIAISGNVQVQTINYLNGPVELVVSGNMDEITVTKGTDLVKVTLLGNVDIVHVSRSHSFDRVISGNGCMIDFYD